MPDKLLSLPAACFVDNVKSGCQCHILARISPGLQILEATSVRSVGQSVRPGAHTCLSQNRRGTNCWLHVNKTRMPSHWYCDVLTEVDMSGGKGWGGGDGGWRISLTSAVKLSGSYPIKLPIFNVRTNKLSEKQTFYVKWHIAWFCIVLKNESLSLVVFTDLKLCLATATHNFKSMKTTLKIRPGSHCALTIFMGQL